MLFPGGLEAHAPGAWEQRGHHGHRSHRVLSQCRVRSLSLKFVKYIAREVLIYIFMSFVNLKIGEHSEMEDSFQPLFSPKIGQ